MAPKNPPTGRQRRLATEVRRLREQVGFSVAEAAERLGADRTLISNIEAGRTGLSEERVRQIASFYRCSDQALIDALAGMTGGRRSRVWWEEYRGKVPGGFLDICELEHYAVRLRTTQTTHLPGILQTEDHARAVFGHAIPKPRPLELELRVAQRMARQAVLDRPDPPQYTGIIHEAALRIQFGGPKTTRAQLEYLAEASERDHITLLVIPFSAGGIFGDGQSVLYAEGPVPQLDTVQLDSALGAVFIDAPAQLVNYRALLDTMEQMALPAAASRDFILAVAREL